MSLSRRDFMHSALAASTLGLAGRQALVPIAAGATVDGYRASLLPSQKEVWDWQVWMAKLGPDTEAPSSVAGQRQRYSRVEMLMKLIELFELTLGRSLADFADVSPDQQLTLLLNRLIAVKLLPARTPIQVLCGIVRVFEANLNTEYLPTGAYCGPVATDANQPSDLLSLWRPHAPAASFWRTGQSHDAASTAGGDELGGLAPPLIGGPRRMNLLPS